MSAPALSYCGQLARQHDYHRYLCALFAPSEIREGWFALFAFHYEINHIADAVSEEMVGFVRYAWWRETLSAIYDGKPPRGHPVAEALAPLVKGLPKMLFESIIDAHEQALAEKQALDEAFLQATSGALMELCAGVAGKTGCYAELGTAFGAIEAAGLRSMDGDHRAHFLEIARARLPQKQQLDRQFLPFLYLTEFFLKKTVSGAGVALGCLLRSGVGM